MGIPGYSGSRREATFTSLLHHFSSPLHTSWTTSGYPTCPTLPAPALPDRARVACARRCGDGGVPGVDTLPGVHLLLHRPTTQPCVHHRAPVAGPACTPYTAGGQCGKEVSWAQTSLRAWVRLPREASLPSLVSLLRRSSPGWEAARRTESGINWIAAGQERALINL